ncbi:proto-oncogene vav-like isoform X2 [Saccostrea cucullata]|uniref:proto-oncogene vav-like isoform X2 n=1 Tax=Saccostrea cuccullata TaxID=36930 RepID=UPI002ED317CE
MQPLIYTCIPSVYVLIVHIDLQCLIVNIRDLTGQVRALCNYNGTPSPGAGRPALSFQKDDVIKLLNNDAQWWKGLLNGDEGWFPSQLVQEENNPRKNKAYDGNAVWFVGPMDRDTANRRLGNMPNGTFLIRVSENPGRRGELSLSIRGDNQEKTKIGLGH